MTLRPRFIIWLALGLIVAGCSTPTPIAQLAPTEPVAVAATSTSTAIPPTAPPTATAVPPTATSTAMPEPSATATATSTPTVTPAPTKLLTTRTPAATKVGTTVVTATMVATAKPTTVQPVSGSSAGFGAVPAGAPLNVAAQRTLDNMLELNKGINGVMVGAAYTCEQFLGRFNAITQSPTYEVHDQTQEIQTAYSYYRSGIDTVKTQMFEIWRTCDRGGGVVDKLKWGEAIRGLSEAIGALDRAVKLLPAAPATGPEPTATPKPATVTVNMALSDLLLQTMERMHTAGGHLDGAQTDLNAGFCDRFKPLYETIITVVGLDETGRAPIWIDSYGAYKVAIGYFQNKLYRAIEVCNAGGGAIGKSEFGDMRRATDAAAVAVARAYDRLRAENLLGQ